MTTTLALIIFILAIINIVFLINFGIKELKRIFKK
jgi:hypothetical protein